MLSPGRVHSLWSELLRRREAGVSFPDGMPLDPAFGGPLSSEPPPFEERAPLDVGEEWRRPLHRGAIAVLPFSSPGRREANEVLGAGFAEDVISYLSCCATLQVIARTSAMTYKGTSKDVQQIAAELGVEVVLEGSVRRMGEGVRVAARLVDAASRRHLWKETYTRPLAEVFDVQRELVEAVTRVLRAELPPHRARMIQQPPTKDFRAYDLFLRGRQEVYRYRTPDIHRGIRRLERATRLDPDFAAAHAMIAIAHLASPCWAGVPSRMALPRARYAARRSLELDDTRGLAWVALAGTKYLYDWDWVGAEKDLMRAGDLEPSLPDLFLWSGILLILLERFDEAATWLDRGLALDPHSSALAGLLGFARHLGGHRREGLAVLRAAAERDPGNFYLEHIQGWCFMDEQRFKEAAEAFGAGVHITGGHPYPLAARAIALHLGGQADQAAGLIAAIRERCPEGRVTPMLGAYMALVDGDPDEVVAHLWAAADERSHTVLWFRAVPLFRRALGDHPGWRALLRRIWPADFPEPRD